jgi:hypothetical protein
MPLLFYSTGAYPILFLMLKPARSCLPARNALACEAGGAMAPVAGSPPQRRRTSPLRSGRRVCENLRLPHEMPFTFLFHRGNLRMRYALCAIRHALCAMLSALCPMHPAPCHKPQSSALLSCPSLPREVRLLLLNLGLYFSSI